MFHDHGERRPFELEPGEITRPPADERLCKGKKHHQQARGHGIELRFDAGVQHVGESDAKRPAEHEIRNDPHFRQKDTQPEKDHGQREPLHAAEIIRDVRLRGRIN